MTIGVKNMKFREKLAGRVVGRLEHSEKFWLVVRIAVLPFSVLSWLGLRKGMRIHENPDMAGGQK